MIIRHSDMFNNLRDTVRCLPAQHKHPERRRVHNNMSTNSTNKQHAHMYANISGEKTVISQLNKWFASYLICKISPLYSRGGFYFSPSAHSLPLIPWVIPSVSQHRANYAWKEGRTTGWREHRGERAHTLKEKWICFLFPLKKKVQTLCYWNEKEMFLMWENPLASVQAVRWHRQ